MALLPIALLSLLGLAWWMGWGLLRVLVVIFIVWVAVLAFMLAAPASEIRAGMGIDVELWLAGGLLLGLVTVYFAIVRHLKAELAEIGYLFGRPLVISHLLTNAFKLLCILFVANKLFFGLSGDGLKNTIPIGVTGPFPEREGAGRSREQLTG